MSFITSKGVVGFSNKQDTAVPNAAIPVSYFASSGSFVSIDAAIVPRGLGSLVARIPNNLASGGIKRGSGAVDLQIDLQNAANQVAEGAQSVISGGNSNRIELTAFSAGITHGFLNHIKGPYSRGGGRATYDYGMYGVDVFGGNITNTEGDTQLVDCVMFGVSNVATPISLGTSGSGGAGGSVGATFTMIDRSLMSFDIDILAIGNGSGEYAAWNVRGACARIVGAASSTLIGPAAVTTLGLSAGFAAIVAPTVNVDIVTGGWYVACTGLAGVPIKFQAAVRAQNCAY